MSTFTPSSSWNKEQQQQPILRKGKWTIEEENYANKIIDLFNQGRLPIMAGTTLRSYLSDKLRCDPMRITKKYAGTSCIGKQIFQPCDDYTENVDAIKQSEMELAKMEQLFLMRIQSKGLHDEDSGSGSQEFTVTLNNNQNSSSSSLRRNTPRNCSKTDLAAAFSAELTSSAQRWRGKRVRSAPDLTELLGRNDSTLRSYSRSTEDDDGYRGSQIPFSTVTIAALQTNNSNTTAAIVLPPNQTPLSSNSSSSKMPLKRSHSVMALMDFEKLVADDNAASELFLEFVTQIDQKRRTMQQNHHNNNNNHHNKEPSYLAHNYAYLQPLTQKVPTVFNGIMTNHSSHATVASTAEVKHAKVPSTDDGCTATLEVNELAVEAAESKEQDEQRILPSDETPNGVTTTTKEEEEAVMVAEEEDKNERNENNDSAEEGNFF